MQGIIVQLLNILVIVLLPLKLLMKTPALLSVFLRMGNEGQQVRSFGILHGPASPRLQCAGSTEDAIHSKANFEAVHFPVSAVISLHT